MLTIENSSCLRPEDARVLFGWSDDPFQGRQYGLTWAQTPLHYVGRLKARPVSHVGVLDTSISIDGKLIRVAGIGGVITPPEHQGKGFARRLISAAVDDMKKRPVQFGFLFCPDRLLGFYGGQGWKKISGTTDVLQPDGIRRLPLNAMIFDFSGNGHPDGSVRLDGFPW